MKDLIFPIFCFISIINPSCLLAQDKYFVALIANDISMVSNNQAYDVLQKKTFSNDFYAKEKTKFTGYILNGTLNIGKTTKKAETAFGIGFGRSSRLTKKGSISSKLIDSNFSLVIRNEISNLYVVNFYRDRLFRINADMEYALGFLGEFYYCPRQLTLVNSLYTNNTNSQKQIVLGVVDDNSFLDFNSFFTTKFNYSKRKLKLSSGIRWGVAFSYVADNIVLQETRIVDKLALDTRIEERKEQYFGARYLYLPYLELKYFLN
jgi:hypothetical protein